MGGWSGGQKQIPGGMTEGKANAKDKSRFFVAALLRMTNLRAGSSSLRSSE
jgi:hypothetical protein